MKFKDCLLAFMTYNDLTRPQTAIILGVPIATLDNWRRPKDTKGAATPDAFKQAALLKIMTDYENRC